MKSTTCITTDATPLKSDDGDWKTLFGVPNSTHTDFRRFLLSRGWQEVHNVAIITKD
jgi:hypothetical protein